MHKALHPREDIDYVRRKKKEENSPASKIVWMHPYDNSKTILKRIKKE